MEELIAIDLPAGPEFVDALRRTWEAGDAAFPIDQRLPRQAQVSLLDRARPHAIIASADGNRVPIEPHAPRMDPDDALLIATSGSTGSPRLYVHSDEALASHAWAVNERLQVDPQSDRWLCCLPVGHMGGLGVLARALITDTPLHAMEDFDAEAVARAPQELGSTLVSLVPAALDRLDPSGYRWVVLGGGPDHGARPSNVIRTYGLTETCGGIVYEGIPLRGVEIRLDEDGAIAVRGPMVSRGERNKLGEVVPIADADGWFTTNDVGHWDDAGRLVVDGRSDDLIITGGENVWPAPVEAAIATHSGVKECVVVGRTDHDWGQRVVAVVVPSRPAWPPTLEELKYHVRNLLPPYAAPKELVVVDSLPKTPLGKIRRPKFDDDGADS